MIDKNKVKNCVLKCIIFFNFFTKKVKLKMFLYKKILLKLIILCIQISLKILYYFKYLKHFDNIFIIFY